MAPNPGHHHRSTTKVAHKPFKSKHASKSALKERSKGTFNKESPTSSLSEYCQAKSNLDSMGEGERPTSRSCRSWTDEIRPSRSELATSKNTRKLSVSFPAAMALRE